MPEQPARKKRFGRWLLAAGIALLLLLGAVAFLFPFLLKRYIERHSVEWIGRRITIGDIILNPFTYTYAIHGVKCFEPGSSEVFVSWKSISVKSDLWAGFRNNKWRFRKLRIEQPYFHLVQHGDRFNFSDLLELGGSAGAKPRAEEKPVLFSMEDILLDGGKIIYASDILKAPVSISALRANCTRITSESARMDFGLGFTIDGGGSVKGSFKIDTEKSRYGINAVLNSFSLPLLLPYLQDFMHTTGLKGVLDLGLHLEDSWADTAALAAAGHMAIHGLEVTDGSGKELLGLKDGRLLLDTLNARDHLFRIGHVLLDGLFTRYSQWPDGSNTWTKALKLGQPDENGGSTELASTPGNVFVMLADYVRLLGQEFVANEYTADSMAVANGTVEFEDLTPEKPFRYTLDRINLRSSRITTRSGTADFSASARLNGRGELASTFRFDPRNFRNVAMDLSVKDLVLPDLDAYSRWYAAYPITSGTLSYTGSTTIRDGKLDSQNLLASDNLRFGKKTDVHDTGIFILPLRLAASLLRDVHGKIDLKVPVTGDLNDPTFKPWPIVWQVLKNLVVKAAAAPVRLVAGLFGAKDDADVEEVRFRQLSTSLEKDQRRALDALAAMLKEKQDLRADLACVTDTLAEKEAWAAQQVKMEFLGLQSPLTKADSAKVAGLSLRDSSFTVFLNGKSPGTRGQAEVDRCVAVVGTQAAAAAVQAEEEARKIAVQAYLEKAGAPAARFAFRPATKEELAGYKGDPGYRFIVEAKD